MLSMIMENGQALYVLAGIAGLGVFTRLLTRNLYKRLMKESTNLAAAKNKGLKELRQRAENSYSVNQGMRDTGSWVEHQLGELRFRGMTLAGWSNLSTQLTWLCLLMGGLAAFYSYWYRLDTYYIVLYGGGSILMAMATMLFDGSIAAGRRDQLIVAIQDYLENTMFPRLGRLTERNGGSERQSSYGSERKSLMERNSNPGLAGTEWSENAELTGKTDGLEAHSDITYGDPENYRGKRTAVQKMQRTRERSSERMYDGGRAINGINGSAAGGSGIGTAAVGGMVAGIGGSASGGVMPGGAVSGAREGCPQLSGADRSDLLQQGTDDLKRGLEQIAASRERSRQFNPTVPVPSAASAASAASSASIISMPTAENLLKELSPQELQVINDILKQYLN